MLPVAACTGGGTTPGATAAPVTSSPTPSATPTATPTPTASYKPADASGRAQNVPVPVLPEAAKAETKTGLEAFARYWFQLLSYGYETGDVSRLVAITSPACRACDRATTVMKGWHEEGRWIVGGKTKTPSVSTTFTVAPDGNYQVAIQVSQSSLSYYNADGTLHQADPKPEDTGNLMLAVFRDGAWYVNNIQPIVG
ncbi:DUF6318 family protein [Arthrobacter sp. Leaf69]|uniref:DUF6318 family protein n=1 Tax=Arthrobacter sp. Leaf69 TaxID=1736232 RepID=UPI002286C3C8|nr:DUF6318 family protein [Arthrobacter sp. Leaf69]